MPTLPEVVLILFIILVVFGAGRVPALGDALGHAVSRLLKRKGDRQDPPRQG